jgi:deoxyribonuclease-1-like protein
MKRKLSGIGLLVLLITGGMWVGRNYEISGTADHFSVRRRGVGPSLGPAPPVARTGNTIRIATFNIQVFGETKLSDPGVTAALCDIVRRFDVVAIQEIRAQRADLIPRFLEAVNAEGAHYDYALGPRLGRSDSKEQYAYLFNRASVEIDPSSKYTIDDPDDLLHREPFVASFRVRGPSPTEAFTFTLVNTHVDPDEVGRELNALDDVYRAVQQDGRGEDDVILLGDFNADTGHFGHLGEVSQLTPIVTGKATTNTLRTAQLDNIVFTAHATTEFTGNAGVIDLVRDLNLTTQQAAAVSDHCPVWAEFSVFEGGTPGQLAERDGGSRR